MKSLTVGSILAVLATNWAVAGILLNEPFSYADGFLTSMSSGRWLTHSGMSNQVETANSSMHLTSSDTEDVSTLLDGQPYPASGATNVFFAHFRVRFTSLPSSSGAWFASFKDGTATGFRGRVFALTSGATPGTFRVGLSTANNTSATITNAADLLLNTTYTVVVRLMNTDSVATLWLNPASESDPSITTSEPASTFTVAAFALRQNVGMGALALDDLVVGTSFADVFQNPSPTAPVITAQPESLTVAEGSNAFFASTASGSAPLSFRWLFGGLLISSATSNTLALTNVTLAQEGDYAMVITNLFGSITSAPARLTVTLDALGSTNVAFTLLSYNAHGNQAADWTTNSSQVQAIGRQVQFFNPDIITFQEIPLTNNGTAQMVNFVAAFRPGYYLATNSGTDGFIRSAILSRFPITRSTKWLDGASLTSFGYDGIFTRDLFEAEINVPDLPQPLHVFTTHLKSGQDGDSTRRRTAEARAISNYFAHGFLTTNSLRPYLLAGDMNEDVAHPPSGGVAIPTMTSTSTGLRLTTPLNPITGSHLTFSIRADNLTRRYDYIFPSARLAANILTSYVFRTDLATNIAPALPGDNKTASDHLPIFMAFSNPYAAPSRITDFIVNEGTATLTWNCVPGGRYSVEVSTDFVVWLSAASNLTASNSSLAFRANITPIPQYFRVRTLP